MKKLLSKIFFLVVIIGLGAFLIWAYAMENFDLFSDRDTTKEVLEDQNSFVEPYKIESMEDVRIISHFNLPDIGNISKWEIEEIDKRTKPAYAYFIRISIPTDFVDDYDDSIKNSKDYSWCTYDADPGREYFEVVASNVQHLRKQLEGNSLFSAYAKEFLKYNEPENREVVSSLLYIIKTSGNESYVCIYVS